MRTPQIRYGKTARRIFRRQTSGRIRQKAERTQEKQRIQTVYEDLAQSVSATQLEFLCNVHLFRRKTHGTDFSKDVAQHFETPCKSQGLEVYRRVGTLCKRAATLSRDILYPRKRYGGRTETSQRLQHQTTPHADDVPKHALFAVLRQKRFQGDRQKRSRAIRPLSSQIHREKRRKIGIRRRFAYLFQV